MENYLDFLKVIEDVSELSPMISQSDIFESKNFEERVSDVCDFLFLTLLEFKQ